MHHFKNTMKGISEKNDGAAKFSGSMAHNEK